MRDADLPVFAWQSPCQLYAFPPARRTAKVRDVARKMLTKRTDAHADQYTTQVSDALRRQMERFGVCESDQDEQIGAFWSQVHQEMVRISWSGSAGNNPRGAA